MSDDDAWMAVAYVARPHALRGVVILKALTRSEDELEAAPLERVFLRRKGRLEGELTIESLEAKPGGLMATFAEIPDRTAAERIVGCELVVPIAEAWEPPEGSYYFWQLEGLEVVQEDGRSLGAVRKVTEGAAHDYLALPSPTKPGREVLVPLAPQFVKNIDLAARRIVVALPEGLLDL